MRSTTSVILQRRGGSERSKGRIVFVLPIYGVTGGDRFMWRHYQTLVPYFSALCLITTRINSIHSYPNSPTKGRELIIHFSNLIIFYFGSL